MANKSFKISGQLDISNIISNTEKLRNALKSSLDTASFQKIEKEFDKLAQAQAAYQQAMKGSFANQSDIKAANKAIADFQKTYAKLSSTVQATLNTKGINISGDLSKGFEEERKAIEAERQRIAKATKEWKTQIQNALTGSSFSKSDQQALARSIFSEEEFKKQIERIKKESGKAFSDMRAEVEGQKANLTTKQGEITSYTDEQKRQTFLSASQQTEYGKLQSKKGVKETALSQQKTDLKKLEKEYDDTKKVYEQRIKELKDLEATLQQERKHAADAVKEEAQYRQQHPGATTRNNSELNRLANETKKRRATIQSTQAQLSERELEFGGTAKELEVEQKKSEQKLDILRASITNLEAEIKTLTDQTNALNTIANTNAEARLSNINTQLDVLKQKLNEIETEKTAQNQQLEDIKRSYDAGNSIDENKEALEKREQALNEQIDTARRAAVENSGLNETLEETSESIRENTEESQKNVDEMDELIDSQNKVNEAFDNMKNSIKTFLSIGSAISGVRQIIQQTFNDIKELDKSFAEIAMVTEYSVQQMWQSYDQYAEMANKLGQSTQSVIQASGLFYQQGLDTEESLALTEDTMKLATLAGLDFAEATSQMTAALRGFHMEMDEGARVTDVYSELAAKAAADVQGIAYAMSKTASIASSAGMEFETTSAFLTQMIETTQEAPENIGTAMKTIIARFTELKENVAGTVDSEFDDLDYNKVDTALKSVGVSLKDTNGQFRDLDDVFLELSEKWNTLDRNSQRYIATIAAGSRQQSRFIAMMENYDRTIELVNTAYDSAGRASEQFAKYQDTVEYKLNQLQNTWEQFRTRFFNSDFFKDIIDGLNGILGKITELSGGQLFGLGAAFVVLGKTLVMNLITGVQTGVKKIGELISNKVQNAFNKVGKVQNYQIQVDIRKEQIKQIEQKLATLKNQKIEFESENKDVLNDLKKIQEEIKKAKEEGRELEFGDNIPDQELIDRAQELDAIDSQIEETANNANEQQDLLGNEEIQLAEAQQRGQILGQTIATSMSAAIVAVTTQDNPMTAVGTVLAAGISGLLPTILPAIGTVVAAFKTGGLAAGKGALEGFITGTAGIGLIIVAITAALTGIIVLAKKASEEYEANKTENKLASLKEEVDNLNNSIEESKRKIEECNNEIKSLEEAQKTYEKLSKRTYLTAEEQEKYNEMVTFLKEQYPEVITYYDEESNRLITQNNLLQEKINKQKELLQLEQRNNLILNSQQLNRENEIDTLNKILDFEEKFGDIQGFMPMSQETDYTLQSTEEKKDFWLGLTTASYSATANQIKGYAENGEDYTINADDLQRIIEDSLGRKLNIDSSGMTNKSKNDLMMVGEYIFDYMSDKTSEAADAVSTAIATGPASDLGISIEDLTFAAENFKNEVNLLATELKNTGITAEDVFSDIREYIYSLNPELSQTQANYVAAQASMQVEEVEKLMTSWTADSSGINTGEFFNSDIVKNLNLVDINDIFDAIALGAPGTKNNLSDVKLELGDKGEEFLRYIGVTDQSSYEELFGTGGASDKATAKVLMDAYLGYVQQVAAENTENANKLTPEADKEIQDLLAEETQLTLTEYQDKLSTIISNYDLNADALAPFYSGLIDQEEIQKLYDSYEQEFVKSLDIGSLQYLNQTLSDLSFTETQTDLLLNSIDSLSTNLNLTEDELNALLQIDLSQGYHEIQSNSQTYIQALMDAGMSLEDATNTFDEYINSISLILGRGVFGEVGAEVFGQQLQTDIKGFKEKYKPLIEARNEMLDNEGAISGDTYFSLIEAGFKDYVKITTNGYELIADKAEEAWTKQAMAPLETLRDQIKINDKLLKEAEDFNKNFFDLNDFTIDEAIKYGLVASNNEYSARQSIGGDAMLVSASAQKLIEKYKELKDAGEDTTEILEKFGDKANFVETMVQQGYTSIEEFTKALQEGKVELSSMEADTWIQGLVNLQEASSEAAEKVNDLKDELADLEEQLIEDKEAVDEAAQALHEAKFGTEDFQSGLDGLINYERPLELINKQLENLKENLTDVPDIEEASAAMNQVADLYEDKMATLQAESKVIDQSLANIRQELLANYSNYISFDENGLAKIDFSYEDMRDSDIIKTDGLEKLIEEYNSTYDMALDKEQEYLDAQKEFDKLKSEARDKYITMEQNVIDIIKEQMQEEIDAVTDKYEALEEADNNYLDALQEAIDKQRKLRDQENQYEDLATKEKKLALMQRDTSGTNRKEVMSLEQEIKDDRQNILDNEIDNLIDSMKELYDKQKEARELEIEAMEAATENMQLINEIALNIISGFTNVEDYQSWLLENNPSVKDMTVTQTEQYLEGTKEEFAGYAQYVSLTTEELKLKTDEINQKADEMFTNTSENIADIGTVIQDAAEKAKQEAIDDAQEAYNEAVEKMDDTQKKITETKEALDKAEDAAVTTHGAAMDEMVKASESAMLKVATAGTEMMIEAEALDLSNSKDVQEFAKTHNFYNEKTREYSRSFVDALANKGYDTSSMTVDKEWQITGTPINGGPTIYLPGTFSTKAEAEAALPEYLNKYSDNLKNLSVTAVIGSEVIGAYKKYATGGLVDYTGLAQVDGTPNKPEAFLSAEDTARIGAAAKLLADLPIFNTTSNAENAVSTNIGDTSIEIHINVENISDDYDVDQMIERVKQDIVDVAKPIGTSVILNK